ncbi:MAG: hypothetical protein JSW53_03885, partial [Candidatus Bathyarchaeota archaeon]
EKTVTGLISNPELVEDLTSYLADGEEIVKAVVGKALISPNIDQSATSMSLEDLSGYRKSLEEDIGSLRKIMKLVSTTTKNHSRVIRKEIREVGREFDEKIAAVRPNVMRKMRDIQKRCDREIMNRSKHYERRLRVLHKDRVKLEKEQYRLNARIERCEAEMKSSRIYDDEGRELQWRQKLRETKKKIPSLRKETEEIDRKITSVETEKKLEISKIRSQYETRTEEAQKDLRELEAAREASTRMKNRETESLEGATSDVIDQINDLMKQKRAKLESLEEIGMPRSHKNDLLVYIPLYLIVYKARQKRRYVIHPPSVIGSMGLLTKLKGVFGMTRMKSFLQHRSKPLASFLNQIVTPLNEDPVFERDTNDAGSQVNVLGTQESRECIRKGLKELRGEGWISENEHKNLDSLLSKTNYLPPTT